MPSALSQGSFTVVEVEAAALSTTTVGVAPLVGAVGGVVGASAAYRGS